MSFFYFDFRYESLRNKLITLQGKIKRMTGMVSFLINNFYG